MTRLEDRLEYLSKNKNRKEFLEKFYERKIITKWPFPYACVEALDKMIERYIQNYGISNPHFIFHNNVAIISGVYIYKEQPTFYKKDGIYTTEYGIRLFYRYHNLVTRRGKKLTDPIEVGLVIDRKDYWLVWHFEGKRHIREYKLEDYYYCSDIDEYKFKNSVGVALKRTSDRGTFRLGGWIFTLGVKYANTPLIVFFNKGYCRDNLYKTEKNYEEYCNEHYGKRRIIKEYERHSKESPLLFDMYGKPIKLAYIPKKDKQKKKLKEELDNKCKEGMQHLVEKRQDLEIYSNGTPVQSVQSFDGA